ncbi:MAG: phosphatase PAP2 family protein, partial [Bdellovibrio sp.]
LEIDQSLFKWINQKGAFSLGDSFFPFLTNILHVPSTLGTLLLLLILWAIWKRQKALPYIAALFLSVGVTDLFSFRVIKQIFYRPRPYLTQPQTVVRVPYAPKSSSFPSNHAANTAALATILSWAFPQGRVFFWMIAFLMGYSRIYVGVHYPSDVLAGWFLGAFIAWSVKIAIMTYLNKKRPDILDS